MTCNTIGVSLLISDIQVSEKISTISLAMNKSQIIVTIKCGQPPQLILFNMIDEDGNNMIDEDGNNMTELNYA